MSRSPEQGSALVTIPLMLICVLLWSSGYVSYKEALTHFDPLVGAFVRQAVGLVLFLAVFGVWLKPRIRAIRPVHWRQYGFIALCEPCLYYIFTSYGVRFTSAAQTGIIISCVPVVVALMAWLVIHEKPGRYLIIGTCIVLAGIGLVNLGAVPSDKAPNPLLGNALLLIACICSGGYMVGLKKFALPYPPLFSAVIQAAAGSIFFAVGLLLPTTELPSTFPLVPTFCLVYTGFSTTFGVYTLFNYCIPRMPIGQLTTFIYLIPVVTMFLSWKLTGEQISSLQMISCALILVGVALSQRGQKS